MGEKGRMLTGATSDRVGRRRYPWTKACFLNASIVPPPPPLPPSQRAPIKFHVEFPSILVYLMHILPCRLKTDLCREYEVVLTTGLEIESLPGTCSATELHRKHVASWVKPLIWRSHRVSCSVVEWTESGTSAGPRLVLGYVQAVQLLSQQGWSSSPPGPLGPVRLLRS